MYKSMKFFYWCWPLENDCPVISLSSFKKVPHHMMIQYPYLKYLSDNYTHKNYIINGRHILMIEKKIYLITIFSILCINYYLYLQATET